MFLCPTVCVSRIKSQHLLAIVMQKLMSQVCPNLPFFCPWQWRGLCPQLYKNCQQREIQVVLCSACLGEFPPHNWSLLSVQYLYKEGKKRGIILCVVYLVGESSHDVKMSVVTPWSLSLLSTHCCLTRKQILRAESSIFSFSSNFDAGEG